jgi:hypothetical protein
LPGQFHALKTPTHESVHPRQNVLHDQPTSELLDARAVPVDVVGGVNTNGSTDARQSPGDEGLDHETAPWLRHNVDEVRLYLTEGAPKGPVEPPHLAPDKEVVRG